MGEKKRNRNTSVFHRKEFKLFGVSEHAYILPTGNRENQTSTAHLCAQQIARLSTMNTTPGANEKMKRCILSLTSAASEELRRHGWPGSVLGD